MGCHESDNVGLSRLGNKKHRSFHGTVSQTACLLWGDPTAMLWGQVSSQWKCFLHQAALRPPGKSQQQLTNHVNETPLKWILQPQPSLHIWQLLHRITTSWKALRQNHPNSWPSETQIINVYYCFKPLGFAIICRTTRFLIYFSFNNSILRKPSTASSVFKWLSVLSFPVKVTCITSWTALLCKEHIISKWPTQVLAFTSHSAHGINTC